MRGRFLLLAPCLLSGLVHGQVQNALAFPGASSQVTVANASALVANSAGISITCWVKPTSNSNTHRGIAGFRDEAVADLYLLKLQGTNGLEARFRNDQGVFYTLNYTGLLLNTWQHLALVYDGSQLILYQNGTQVSSVPASGGITSTTGTFYLGNLPYNTDNFYHDGQLDEVSLWSTALTAQQVDCIAHADIDPASSGLQLYYKMDQGVPGGNNVGITSLVDEMGNANGTFVGVALTGTTSNFVAGAPLGTPIAGQICPGGSYTFNGQALTQPGTYTTSYSTGGACDSVVSLVLTQVTVNTTVIQSGNNLISQAVGAQYQWLDCSNGYAEVAGATAPSFQPTTVGTFAVEVTQNGCVDTSACFPSTVGIGEVDALAAVQVRLNAVDEEVVVTGAAGLNGATVRLVDVQGRSVRSIPVQRDRCAIPVAGLPAGAYLVEVTAREGRKAVRVVLTR